jgi:hypothetical protein
VIERKDVELAHNSLKKWVPELRLFLELYRAGSSAFVHDGHDRKRRRDHMQWVEKRTYFLRGGELNI